MGLSFRPSQEEVSHEASVDVCFRFRPLSDIARCRPAGHAGVMAADSDSIDTLIAALYDTISGPAGVRDWDWFRELFIDGGILISTGIRPDGHKSCAR